MQGAGARPDQEVGVIREQGPRAHREGPRLGQARKPAHELGAVYVVAGDCAPIEAPRHHVVEAAGRRFRPPCGRVSRRRRRGMARGTVP